MILDREHTWTPPERKAHTAVLRNEASGLAVGFTAMTNADDLDSVLVCKFKESTVVATTEAEAGASAGVRVADQDSHIGTGRGFRLWLVR